MDGYSCHGYAELDPGIWYLYIEMGATAYLSGEMDGLYSTRWSLFLKMVCQKGYRKTGYGHMFLQQSWGGWN